MRRNLGAHLLSPWERVKVKTTLRRQSSGLGVCSSNRTLQPSGSLLLPSAGPAPGQSCGCGSQPVTGHHTLSLWPSDALPRDRHFQLLSLGLPTTTPRSHLSDFELALTQHTDPSPPHPLADMVKGRVAWLGPRDSCSVCPGPSSLGAAGTPPAEGARASSLTPHCGGGVRGKGQVPPLAWSDPSSQDAHCGQPESCSQPAGAAAHRGSAATVLPNPSRQQVPAGASRCRWPKAGRAALPRHEHATTGAGHVHDAPGGGLHLQAGHTAKATNLPSPEGLHNTQGWHGAQKPYTAGGLRTLQLEAKGGIVHSEAFFQRRPHTAGLGRCAGSYTQARAFCSHILA